MAEALFRPPQLLPLPAFTCAALAEEVVLAPMLACHIAGLLGIEAASFGPFHWSADSFLNELQNQLAHYVVLLHAPSQCVLGYAGQWLIHDEAHITTVATHPQLRGWGLGELLFTHLLGQAFQAQAQSITLEVRASNFGAQNLYYAYGFHVVGKRPRYYQDNQEDALLMSIPNTTELALQQQVQKRLAYFQSKRCLPQWVKGHLFSKADISSIINV